MDKLIVNNNNILTLLLMDEDDDEVSSFSYLTSKKRKTTDDIFKNRKTEGCFEILINRHLMSNQVKFREYFRINYEQFNFLLSLVENNLYVEPSNRVKNPILPAEKLAVTLRYLYFFLCFVSIYRTIEVIILNFF